MTTIRLACAIAAFTLAGCNLSFAPDFTETSHAPPIYAVYVGPSGYVLVVGESLQLSATATTRHCDIDFCSESQVSTSFSWTSSDPGIVTVSDGLVRAVGRGTAHVTAQAGGVTAEAKLRVGSAYVALSKVGLGGQCALTDAGAAYCWGHFFNSADTELTLRQPRPLAGGLTFSAIAVGGSAACGIATDGQGYCWGSGPLGGASQDFSGNPVLVAGGLTFRSLSVGRRTSPNASNEHACGVAADGSAWCWGADDVGQLGSDSGLATCFNGDIGHDYPCSATPVRVGGRLAFAAISAGGRHTCALTADGTAYCWGDNTWGQLGDSSTVSRAAPAPVPGVPSFAAVVAGSDHTCGLTTAGQVLCWGRNERGELGLGSQDSIAHPAPALVTGAAVFTSLDAAHTTCGLTPDGKVYCWGGGRTEPTLVGGGLTFRSLGVVSLSASFGVSPWGWLSPPLPGEACGIAIDSRWYCWEDAGPPFPLAGPVQP